MLQIVLNPRVPPSMLREGIHTPPRSDNDTVEELLRPPRPSKPALAHQQQNSHDDTIPDKRGPHDEVRQTLS
jgi:hypothetical protein